MTIRSRQVSTGAGLAWVAVLAVFIASGCAAAPRTKPLPTTRIDTSPTTVEAARKYLQGRWSLLSFEVFPPGRPAIRIVGSGTLVYDDFGNLDMQIRVDDQATSEELRHAGISLVEGMISSAGRAVIDMQARTLTYILEGRGPLVPTSPTGPLELGRPRYWEVHDNILTLTTRGNDGQPVAVGRWQKAL
jgi:hypothetical protein